MCASDAQVKAMYEVNGMTVEEISASTGYDPLAVKTCLANYSPQFRKELATSLTAKPKPASGEAKPNFQVTSPQTTTSTEPEDISDVEFEMLRQAAMGIALSSDREFLPTSARMIKFLWNEKKGRNNVNKASGIQVNILQVNEGIRQARAAVEASLKQPDAIIDLEPTTIEQQPQQQESNK